jgi:PHD/YefM family antitoxin component YafN of YafNO toxin-antitoxin module
VNTLTTIGAKYLVDKKGRKKAVLLDMKEYSRLLARMEELEDTLDLDTAARTSPEFRDYREIREELVKEERL